MFLSPAPVKRVTRGRKPKSVATPKKNLNEMLSDSDSEATTVKVEATVGKEPAPASKTTTRMSARIRYGVIYV